MSEERLTPASPQLCRFLPDNDPTVLNVPTEEMRGLLTTQSQNCYREQIQKEMLTRLAWKSRYARLYPSCGGDRAHSTQLPPLSTEPRCVLAPRCYQLASTLSHCPPCLLPFSSVLPPVIRTPGNHAAPPPPAPPPAPPLPSVQCSEGPVSCTAPPLMRPVSPHTRKALYQDSSHQVRKPSVTREQLCQR